MHLLNEKGFIVGFGAFFKISETKQAALQQKLNNGARD